jgi:hypothetical protein
MSTPATDAGLAVAAALSVLGWGQRETAARLFGHVNGHTRRLASMLLDADGATVSPELADWACRVNGLFHAHPVPALRRADPSVAAPATPPEDGPAGRESRRSGGMGATSKR